ncbi:MAG: hypothetical protein QMD85_04635, partial [Candidatus Aenigmarchaeota archaeon]|nr:hypothetical protein [Candidatus Aenigmarchaeota archaeon]MDI6722851.1 hypothetical protein [Candidatus Aenigmarchaeota archaeon]
GKYFVLLLIAVAVSGCVSSSYQNNIDEQDAGQIVGSVDNNSYQEPIGNESIATENNPPENYSDAQENFSEADETNTFDYFNYNSPEAEIKYPLLIKFPIARSPMPYYIISDPDVNPYKYNLTLENIRIAFEYWQNATKGRVKFMQADSKPEEGIIIYITPKNYYTYDIPAGASRQEVAGEAGPIYYKFANYSIIVGGEITIGPLYGTSENRVQIMHEIGHIMGFGHNNNSHSVLYPWVAYSQEITPDITEALDVLYQDVSSQ